MISDVLRRDPEFSRVLPMSIMTSGPPSELEILKSNAKPFLLGHGKAERVINGSYLRDIVAKGLPVFEGKVEEWEGAGHTPQIENAAAYTASVKRFADSVFGI